ncbi:TIGR02281 family clan AA aspartic protease [Novosphingobium sp. 1949]|uniref:TIGR02281 family clan AA aspartic protease n=1 Tax=Novosphingobium organovorum TaxID=2930092 RepID=A0ABT0B828_9SPHN|nr:TIGR02281 family clan AA aspartic protease [Novosphingobium organovorum]MCJ2181225.1 TIGR02281 family clan AA aspartic protease [Novosphingobium organovorum]
MDLAFPTDAKALLALLAGQPLLFLAAAALAVTFLGAVLRGPLPILGGFIKGVGNLGLLAAFLLTVAQFARFNSGFDIALPQIGIEHQSVAGRETRVKMSPDGHFWITAAINGARRDFLVDTGATLTAIAPSTAEAAAIEPPAIRRTVAMRTANGTVAAEVVTIDELRFGNIVARDLDAIVAPGLGDQNVIGMNLLSRLASWRVEGRTLILVPNHPQPEEV